MSFIDALRKALDEVSEKSEVNISKAVKSSEHVMRTIRPLSDKHFHDALDSHSKVIAGVLDRPVYGYCKEWRGASSYYADEGGRGDVPMEHFDFKPLPKTLEEDMEEVKDRVGGMGLGEALRRVDVLTGGVMEMVGEEVGGEGKQEEGSPDEVYEDEPYSSPVEDVKFPSMDEMRLSFGSVASATSATSAASANTSVASRTSEDPMDFLNKQREKLAALQGFAEVSKMQSDLVNRVQESMKRIGQLEKEDGEDVANAGTTADIIMGGSMIDMLEVPPRPPLPISGQEFRKSQEWIESRAPDIKANPRHRTPMPSEFYESIASEEYEDDFESFEEKTEEEVVVIDEAARSWADNLDVWASVNFASANVGDNGGAAPKRQDGSNRRPPPKPSIQEAVRGSRSSRVPGGSMDSVDSDSLRTSMRDSTTPEIAERILRMAKMRREKLQNMKKHNR
ncbi:hypothetical protein TrRE_jg10221 [Triparma retinervis]|uniref:Uncharacterized protein n=1 Tax=Triparma retinervis TaxID=2557542 RepID=A0A9W7DPH5_9STRA|nr:hypothetical protein TrRE_jg10221 [Triparma retinervis]